MTLYFITGNQGKFDQTKAMLPDIEQLDIHLPEIQDIDPLVIIKAKLEAAFEHHQGPFIVEDTSLHLDALGGLPGPLIKWFIETIGVEGIADVAQKMGNTGAEARVIIGYAEHRGHIKFFEATDRGQIVSPRGDLGYGWDPIFVPEGQDVTYGEMELAERNKIAIKGDVAEQLKQYLKDQVKS